MAIELLGGQGGGNRGVGNGGGSAAAAAKSPNSKKKTSGAKNSPLANGAKSPPTLLEAVSHLLRTQTTGPSMRLSSLISTLYEMDDSFKEEIKQAGGAKTWLSIHSNEFYLDTDCAPGHESVTLNTPLPPPPSRGGAGAGGAGGAGGLYSPPESPQHGKLTSDDEHISPLPPPVPIPASVNSSLRSTLRDRLTMRNNGNGSDDDMPLDEPSPTRTPGRRRNRGLLAGALEEDDDNSAKEKSARATMAAHAAADAADDDAAMANALLGAVTSGDGDPLLIEKKIRAVQKKLRRVQTIEQGSGSDLDSGQQVLLASKPRLQALLAQLLEQWAVLEPALLEQQQKSNEAIANSECAICLEEYSADSPGIRTSCCGYHFHNSCLQQCIESTGHCPICSAPKNLCKVVQQRRPGAAAAAAAAIS